MGIILIDGDELAYKSSVPKSAWRSGMNIYTSKKLALKDRPDAVPTKFSIQPHKSSVTTQIDSMVNKITRRIKELLFWEDAEVKAVVSGSTNFRKERYESYKSNRITVEKPFYLQMAKDYIVEKYNGVVSEGEEADDVISILNNKFRPECVIASSDKDFKTCICHLYNIMHDSMVNIHPIEADKNFWIQVLMGDRADGVDGLYGMGIVKSTKLLENCVSTMEMALLVRDKYAKAERLDDFKKNAFLLHLRNFPGEMFDVQ